MYKTVLLCLLIAAVSAAPQFNFETPFNGTQWVVLVAGSNFYYNYRHQSDVYHAYQVVKEHGIPDENVIVFHYDDIANDPQNPYPGNVINRPNGPNVYPGVPKDYTGADVTPENFLAAIQGDETLAKKGKKVVKSGPNDHIFIYFTDHGAPGLVAFPSEYLYATDLNKVLKKLHDDKKYSKLVFYIEACESGSMFDGLLPKNINIYATTASNPTESSYACYFDDKRQTYLGDVYSVKWIENSDKKSLGNEKLVQQFEIVKKETTTSHVEEYGDLSMGSLPLTQFQGAKSADMWQFSPNLEITDAVDSGDAAFITAIKKIDLAKNEEEKALRQQEFAQLSEAREYLYQTFRGIFSAFTSAQLTVPSEIELFETKRSIVNHECYQRLVNTFHRRCFNLNKHSYGLRKLYTFVNFCEHLHEVHPYNAESFYYTAENAVSKYCVNHYTLSYPYAVL